MLRSTTSSLKKRRKKYIKMDHEEYQGQVSCGEDEMVVNNTTGDVFTLFRGLKKASQQGITKVSLEAQSGENRNQVRQSRLSKLRGQHQNGALL